MTGMLEPVLLPPTVHAAIITHARAGKPEEICGVVRGRGLAAFEAVAGRNTAAERIENYEVDPQTLLLQFAFEDAGDEMMGIYHSHPVSVAWPSATDAWNAYYPECVYFICSLEHDDAPMLRAFRLTTHWIDVDAEQLRSALPFYETRPHLFAYYQPANAPLPDVLRTVAADVHASFYIDFMTGEQGEIIDTRVVSVAEHPVQIVAQ
jgi:proteasome lid subunit RPN8/RPN11